MRGAGPAGSPGRSQCTVLPPGGGGFPLFGPHVLKKDRTGGAAAKTRAERHDTAREERAVRVQARGPHEGEPRLAGSCGARRFRVLPDALASAAERAVACGQFDDLGLPCVSHYVAEAPQEFEALPDGPQVGGVRMARGRIASRQCGSRPKETLRCHRHGSVRLIYGAGGHHGRRVDGVDGSTTMDRVAAGKLPTTERRDIAAQRDRRVSRPVGRRAAPERRARARKHY